MRKILLVGSGGREGAFALNIIKDSSVYAVIDHENPTIVDCVTSSDGKYIVANSSDPIVVSQFAIKHNVDYAFVSADNPLANGVVDALLENNIKAIGGTKEATRIEWDKIYSIEMVEKVCPEYNSFFKVISKKEELQSAVDEFIQKGLDIVVKPQGLTGGKGVKVMPEHLKNHQEALEYAQSILVEKPNEKVLLVEKLHGIEFTIMGITDGANLVMAPASYDYPFRLENDLGAGTGGMGCFTNNELKLPFMNENDLESCRIILQRIIDEMRNKKLIFNGVLNGGFFKTAQGIKFMEFNSRFGDPEALNVLSVISSPFSKLIENIWSKSISNENITFYNKASVIKYLVAKEYPNPSKEEIPFEVDEEEIKKEGVKIFYATCIKEKTKHFKTLKKSRVVAFGAISDSISEASDKVNDVIKKHVKGNLEYRKDIGSKDSLKKINDMNNSF